MNYLPMQIKIHVDLVINRLNYLLIYMLILLVIMNKFNHDLTILINFIQNRLKIRSFLFRIILRVENALMLKMGESRWIVMVCNNKCRALLHVTSKTFLIKKPLTRSSNFKIQMKLSTSSSMNLSFQMIFIVQSSIILNKYSLDIKKIKNCCQRMIFQHT